MKKRLFCRSGVALIIALALVTIVASPTFAHEKRQVGKYTFVVGFLNEPAYVNQLNSLDLTVCLGTSCNYTVQDGSRVVSNPVNDLEKTLKVEVSTGAHAPIPLTIDARYGNPGKYTGYFEPTTTGNYTFHIYGTIGTDKIDEKFTSSPTGFGAVEEMTAYPAAQTQGAPAASDNALQSQLVAAQNAASTATTIGIVGAILGVLGIVLAGVSLARRPKSAVEAAKPEPVESLQD
jgi:hypothetical protein